MQRPCLILIPGLLNDAELWRDQVVALTPIYDVRVADITRGETMAALAEAVFAIAPEQFSVAGFSLGAMWPRRCCVRRRTGSNAWP